MTNESVNPKYPSLLTSYYGCSNCVWKAHHICPLGYVEPHAATKEGYCDKFMDLLVILVEEEDKLSAVKAKVFLYVQELQAEKDYKEFINLSRELQQKVDSGVSKKELAALEMRIQVYRMWWMKLTENLIKAHNKIADREQRKDNILQVEHKIDLGQLHDIMNNAKMIEDKKKDVIDI